MLETVSLLLSAGSIIATLVIYYLPLTKKLDEILAVTKGYHPNKTF